MSEQPDKCPKCGAERDENVSNFRFSMYECGYIEGQSEEATNCLRRQLAQAQAERDEADSNHKAAMEALYQMRTQLDEALARAERAEAALTLPDPRQAVAADCIRFLEEAGFGKPGTPNTLWAMTKAACAELIQTRAACVAIRQRLWLIFHRAERGDGVASELREVLDSDNPGQPLLARLSAAEAIVAKLQALLRECSNRLWQHHEIGWHMVNSTCPVCSAPHGRYATIFYAIEAALTPDAARAAKEGHQ